ncbi:MAG TPA: hypothetical protein VFZ48_00760 [Candidatus Saccharimonadales bacterium]
MKDVIYIDIEDDITSIIEKVKAAKAKIVALVPPKRVGVLQSAVNLKLLQKASIGAEKRLVLITSDQALSSLAAGVHIPVAKNLQSKPEVAPIAALEVDDEDVINGEDISIGELDDAAKAGGAGTPVAFDSLKSAKSDKAISPAKDKLAGKNPFRIPNFDRFRKWLFLGVGGGVLLIAFLIWAIFFAPRATVAITAKTTLVNIDLPLTLDPDAKTNPDKNIAKPLAQELKKTQTVDFAATGQKDVGDKATGSMTLTNESSSDPVVVSGGTAFTSGDGYVFTSNSDVTVPGATIEGGQIVGGKANVAVTAEKIGSEYNLAAQSYNSGNSSVTAEGGPMSGGSKRTVKVVSQADVDKAKQQLKDQNNDAAKDELKQKLGGDVVIIDESFTATVGDPSVSPAVGHEASQAKLTVETAYTLLAISKPDMKAILDNALNKQLEGKEDQRIYENGDKSVRFSRFERQQAGLTVRLTTVAYIGPSIDEKELTKQLEGKRYGEIQQHVEAIPGVENVETSFWPFWVTSAPSADKISIKFVIKNE